MSDPGTRGCARGVLFLGYGIGHGPRPTSVVSTHTFPRIRAVQQCHLGPAGQGIGRARVLQATRLNPPFLHLHLGQAGLGIGRARVLQATRLSPPFLCLHLCLVGLGIGRARVLQLTRLSPPLYIFNLVGQVWALEGHKSSKLPSLAHPFVPSTSTTCQA
jgi:hypothetical protein